MNEQEEKSLKYIGDRLGRAYIEKTLDNFNGDAAARVRESFDKHKSIYIYGACGTGKTHLLAGIAHLALDSFFCILKSDRLNSIASDYSNEDRNYLIGTWCGTRLLLLDDIGIGKLTPERHTVYYKILDIRSSNHYQTIYTSNLEIDKLWTATGDEDAERLRRRIKENCEVIKI